MIFLVLSVIKYYWYHAFHPNDSTYNLYYLLFKHDMKIKYDNPDQQKC